MLNNASATCLIPSTELGTPCGNVLHSTSLTTPASRTVATVFVNKIKIKRYPGQLPPQLPAVNVLLSDSKQRATETNTSKTKIVKRVMIIFFEICQISTHSKLQKAKHNYFREESILLNKILCNPSYLTGPANLTLH